LDFFAVSETSPEDRLAASADEGPVAVGEGVRVGRRRTKGRQARRRAARERGRRRGGGASEREKDGRVDPRVGARVAYVGDNVLTY
jgi:hypothetical protein